MQYPNAEWMFMADLRCIGMLVRLAQPDAVPAYEEFAKQFQSELDYQQEGENLRQCHAWLPLEFSSRIVIPAVFPHLCSNHVLTMT